MADTAISVRNRRAFAVRAVLDDYSNAAITTGTNKREWIVPFDCRIVDVICDAETAGTGGTSNIIDVNINGTTVYTTQANRPTLLTGDTGLFSEAGEPQVTKLAPGDVVSYDVDQVSTTGCARFKIAIVLAMP